MSPSIRISRVGTAALGCPFGEAKSYAEHTATALSRSGMSEKTHANWESSFERARLQPRCYSDPKPYGATSGGPVKTSQKY